MGGPVGSAARGGMRVHGDKDGRFVAIARPAVGAAPGSGGQDEAVTHVEHAGGETGIGELAAQLPLDDEDHIDTG